MATQVMEAPPKGEGAAALQRAKVQGAYPNTCSWWCISVAVCAIGSHRPCLHRSFTAKGCYWGPSIREASLQRPGPDTLYYQLLATDAQDGPSS